jgi:mannose-6-phosphate isomerase-like protein (cupin superfamily)
MTQKVIFPNWKELVTYSEKGMQPNILVETENYKSVVAGMAPGNSMPAHVEGPAIFHFLEGSGKMIVGEETFDVLAGVTVVVPNGARRGIESETQLAFLAVRLPE